MDNKIEIVLLGTGTSQGVPVIACDCKVCKSLNPKDKRLRASVIIIVDNQTLVVDTGPDFRQQMLRENVQNIDAVLFTHHHKDHVAGMDDIRAFNHKWKKDINVYCSKDTEFALKNEFPYVFSEIRYPGVPSVKINRIDEKPFTINNTEIVPINVLHYKMQVFGFRIYNFIYLTDVSEIPEKEKQKMQNADVIVLDALRRKKHISHFSLVQAVDLLQELKPKKAYLTHISHFMGLHDEVNNSLPNNIQLAFDGLKIILNK